ncbi:hypothetical protein CRG98_022621 [Punica granatum]|uniref:Uncharacterized protein n=1 Tax=Punica granatum TaxID=22663 RepID=A0A2I0JN78_PUNGR|nr:hypothetical protein CRG98_022621 [Punica granatum]
MQEGRARWLGELAAQESKLARVSRPGKVARGTSERHERGGSANLRCRKVNSHGLPHPPRLQEHERGGSANLRGRKVNSHRLADPPRLQEARASWLGEVAV